MRLPSGSADRYLYFVAVDSTDLKTRETGLSSFTVYRSRNGGAAAAMTTPTVNETDVTNMPGVYELLIDEDTTIDAGDDEQEMVFHITQAGMAPVTRVVEVYRPKITEGSTSTPQTGDSFARLGAPAGASVSADVAVVDANVDTLLTRITSTLFNGITSLAEWLGLIAGKQTGDATARAELRATGSASGTYDETTDSQEAIRERGDAAWAPSGSGTGARTITATVDDGTTPLESATIRLTKGAESYTATTDASGNATLNIDDGTWTVAITLAGHTFAGTTIVVTADASPTWSMTAISITPAADPAQTTGYLTTRDGKGDVEVSVVITFALVEKDDAGQSYETDTFTATSDASTGLLEVALIRGASYNARRGDLGPAVPFTAGNDATYQLPQVLGGNAANQLE